MPRISACFLCRGSNLLWRMWLRQHKTQGPLRAIRPSPEPSPILLVKKKKKNQLPWKWHNSLPPQTIILEQDFPPWREENLNWFSCISSSTKAPKHLGLLRIWIAKGKGCGNPKSIVPTLPSWQDPRSYSGSQSFGIVNSTGLNMASTLGSQVLDRGQDVPGKTFPTT